MSENAIPAGQAGQSPEQKPCCPSQPGQQSCCSSAAQEAKKLDAREKALINFSLALMGRCEPCFAVHYKGAKAAGISPSELDDAAWCAITMGGAMIKMFYMQQLKMMEQEG